jgi:hypothetical protein
MASNHLRRHAGRTAVVALAAIIGVGIATLAATSDEPSKPGPVLRPEGSSVSASRANDAAPALTGVVPARAAAPAGVTCPGGWSYFDNPVMHYGLCIPPGWGFSDFHQASPLDQVPAVQLENLHLLGNAFPWHPGALPFEAVRRGTLDVELDILPATAQSTDECQPATKKPLGALTVLTCEQPYNDAGLPAAAGPLRALKVIIPLRSVPSDGMPESAGARLLIIARSRAGASSAEVTTLWQIVRSVHPY